MVEIIKTSFYTSPCIINPLPQPQITLIHKILDTAKCVKMFYWLVII